ncbi:MAG: hypothetical protein K0U38_09895 [Epsilonproteobacteria bacterium]|nr:hypothetical protein [Campylobacterota bacterium]
MGYLFGVIFIGMALIPETMFDTLAGRLMFVAMGIMLVVASHYYYENQRIEKEKWEEFDRSNKK